MSLFSRDDRDQVRGLEAELQTARVERDDTRGRLKGLEDELDKVTSLMGFTTNCMTTRVPLAASCARPCDASRVSRVASRAHGCCWCAFESARRRLDIGDERPCDTRHDDASAATTTASRAR